MTDLHRRGRAALVPALGSLLLAACGAADERPPAWDPELGGTTDPSADTTTSADGPGADTTAGETLCVPGEVSPCACPDGLSVGERECDPDGLGFGPCECDDVDPGTTTGEDPGGSSDDGGGPQGDVVCYPGMSGDFSTCLPLHAFDPLPEGYEYPPPYQGNDNYRAPVALLDLEEIDPATWLAPNFQLVEIAQVSRGRYAVVQPHAIVSLQALRDQVGAIGINSGYRSPAYNAGLPGSATYSRHMYGDAYDMDPLAASLSTLEVACTGQGGMLVEYTTHVHCDFRFDPVDEQFYGPPMTADEVPRPVFTASLSLGADGAWHAPATGFDEGEPRRRWVARDADGAVVLRAMGGSFVPPPGTATVEVRVGTQVQRVAAVPPALAR